MHPGRYLDPGRGSDEGCLIQYGMTTGKMGVQGYCALFYSSNFRDDVTDKIRKSYPSYWNSYLDLVFHWYKKSWVLKVAKSRNVLENFWY